MPYESEWLSWVSRGHRTDNTRHGALAEVDGETEAASAHASVLDGMAHRPDTWAANFERADSATRAQALTPMQQQSGNRATAASATYSPSTA